MKKIYLIFLLFIFVSVPAFAIIETDQLLNKVYYKNQGYSDEIVRLSDLQRFDPYEPVARPKSKYDNHPISRAVRAFFIYFDPGLDDGRFGGTNEIRFTNNWWEP